MASHPPFPVSLASRSRTSCRYTLTDIVAVIDRDYRYRSVGGAFAAWAGLPVERIVGAQVQELMCSDAFTTTVRSLLDRSLQGEEVSVEAWFELPGEGTRLLATRYLPMYADADTIDGVLMLVRDTTEERKTEEARARSEQRLQLIQDAVRAGTWEWDAVRDEARWSDGVYRILGYQPGAVAPTYANWLAAVHPDDREAAGWNRQRFRKSGEDLSLDYRVVWPDGSVHWVQNIGRAIHDARDRPIGMIGIAIDITHRKQAEERRDLLRAEVDHRGRNLLAKLSSMVALAARDASSVDALANNLRERILAMARAHELVTRRQSTGAILTQLIENELHPFMIADAVTLLGRGDCRLTNDDALNLSLVIHELATNAAKYGALSLPEGRVTVHWRIAGNEETARLQMIWCERHGPPVLPPKHRGFGMQLIDAVLPAGRVDLQFRPAGVRCAITLPAVQRLPELGLHAPVQTLQDTPLAGRG